MNCLSVTGLPNLFSGEQPKNKKSNSEVQEVYKEKYSKSTEVSKSMEDLRDLFENKSKMTRKAAIEKLTTLKGNQIQFHLLDVQSTFVVNVLVAKLHLNCFEDELAEEHINQAQESFKELTLEDCDDLILSWFYCIKGTLLCRLRNAVKESRQCIESASKAVTPHSDMIHDCLLNITLLRSDAEYYAKFQDFKEAENTLQSVLEEKECCKEPLLKAEIQHQLSEICIQRKDVKGALMWLEEFKRSIEEVDQVQKQLLESLYSIARSKVGELEMEELCRKGIAGLDRNLPKDNSKSKTEKREFEGRFRTKYNNK